MLSNSEEEKLRKEILEFFKIDLAKPISPDKAEKVKEYAWTRTKEIEQKRKESLRAPKDIGNLLPDVVSSFGQETESPIEEKLFLALSTRSLAIGKIRTQYPIGPYFADLSLPDVKLAIECDGRNYHSTPGQIAHDQNRTKYLSRLGWTVLRFTGSEIHKDAYGCVDRILLLYERLAAEAGIKESWE